MKTSCLRPGDDRVKTPFTRSSSVLGSFFPDFLPFLRAAMSAPSPMLFEPEPAPAVAAAPAEATPPGLPRLFRRRDSLNWQVRFRCRGRLVRRSAGTHIQSAANEALAAWITHYEQHVAARPSPPPPVPEQTLLPLAVAAA